MFDKTYDCLHKFVDINNNIIQKLSVNFIIIQFIVHNDFNGITLSDVLDYLKGAANLNFLTDDNDLDSID